VTVNELKEDIFMENIKHEMVEKLSQLQWLLHKRHMRKHAQSGGADGVWADNTRGQGRILALLKMQDSLSTKEIAYLLGIRISSLNEILAKLEKSELVTREPSKDDKRVMLIKLTEKGKTVEQPEPEERGKIFSCLTEAEQKAFSGYLDKLISALQAELGVDGTEVNERMRIWRERMAERGSDFDRRRFGWFFRFDEEASPDKGSPHCKKGGHHRHGRGFDGKADDDSAND
jgi:DNA-binding MarR family transcriptional regulator